MGGARGLWQPRIMSAASRSWSAPGVGRRLARQAGTTAQVLLSPALLHLALVTVAGSLPQREQPRRSQDTGGLRFTVLVPAHDEEQDLPATLASLARADQPGGGLDIIVIADHCADGTAQVARDGGVKVWERYDQGQRGKGGALRWALDQLFAEPLPTDAVAVVDADTTVDADFFPRAERLLLAGASVVQGRYLASSVTEPTVVSRLAEVSSACQSVLRQRGRGRLGGAAKLQGNGMVFRREVLQQVPWDAYGVAEDVGYWFRLLRAGVHPVAEPSAGVAGRMPTTPSAAAVQRARWEAGRVEVAREHARPGLLQAFRTRDAVLAEAVMAELIFPPLSMLAAGVAVAGAVSIAAAPFGGRRAASTVTVAQAALVTAHVLAGLRAAGAGRRVYGALLTAPAVIAWKVALKLRTALRPDSGWHRSPR